MSGGPERAGHESDRLTRVVHPPQRGEEGGPNSADERDAQHSWAPEHGPPVVARVEARQAPLPRRLAP